MALPSVTTELADVASLTLFEILPVVVDGFYKSNPLAARLLERDNIKLAGGLDIRQPIIYGKKAGGSYNMNEKFDLTYKKTKTAFVFNWKTYYANVTIDGLSSLQNSGRAAIIDFVDTETTEAELTLKDEIGTDLFSDGTDADKIVGLAAVADDGTNVGSYAGITRDGSAVGTAAKAQYDGTGGSVTLPLMRSIMGLCTQEPVRPDLIITTQTLWDAVWALVQPSQRSPQGPGFDYLIKVGFRVLEFEGAAVVVDSHCPSGQMYFLNTNFLKLVIHMNRNIVPRWPTFQPVQDQDAIIQQLFWAGELVCSAPRFQGKAISLTA